MDDDILNNLWTDIQSGYSTILNDSIFSTLVYRLIHQYSLQINIIPSGQLYTTFNTLLNTLRQSPTRENHDNLFNWIYITFHNLNEYQSFEDYLMNQDDAQNIEVDIPVNPEEGESDVELTSLFGDEDDEDQQNGNGRNPYALLKEHEGKFTAQFKARKPHLRHLKSLKEFAHYILANPTEFNKISKQRANYYRNLIERKGGMKRGKGLTRNFARMLYDWYDPLNKKSFEDFQRIHQTRAIEDANEEENYRRLLADKELLKAEKELQKAREKHKDTTDIIEKIKSRKLELAYNYMSNWTEDNAEYMEARRAVPPEALEDWEEVGEVPMDIGRGRLSKKCKAMYGGQMMKDLYSYHRQIGGKMTVSQFQKFLGGKISTKDFNLMLTESYKKPQDRKNIGDYHIDESLSTPESVVYHNPKTNETKVAYRGTEGTLKDWGNNALYTFGLHNKSKRYKRANETQKKVEQKYGTDQLDVLGHSQSGAFSQEIGKNAKNVVVLNPASHPLYTPKTKNTTVVRSKGDSVSALKYLNPFNWGKKADVEIEAKTYNPVTEHMPSVLERLPEDQMLGEGRTYKQKFNKKYGFPKDASHSLTDISKITGYDKKHLQMIIDKGKGAYFSNPQSVRPNVNSPEQWSMARLYASLDPTSKAHKIDKSHLIKNKKLRQICDCGDANCKFC